MRAEESPEDGSGGKRGPLPSVDIPLLREQRRAARVKQLAALVVLGVCVVGGITAAIVYRLQQGGDGGGEESEPPALAAATATAAKGDAGPPDAGSGEAAEGDAVEAQQGPVTPGAVSRERHGFGDAKGFRPALHAAGIEGDQAAELEQALGEVLDFRRCRPEDEMVVELDTEGRVVLFEYHGRSRTEFVRATRSGGGELEAERVERPVQTERIATGAKIETSLGEALIEAGLDRSLVSTFLGAFGGKVDFARDTRKGDRFRIIVDEERLEGEFLRWGTVHALEFVGKRTGTLRAFWFEPRKGEADFYDADGRSLNGWLRDPCRFDRISSPFDMQRKHPILGRVVPHTGIDYAAGRGTPVWAAAPGTVTFAGNKGANGNLVAIKHRDGFKSFYAHLQRIERGIEQGTEVEQKQVIGYVGSTGRSTGPHLHFGLKRHGRFVDPMDELNGPGRRMRPGALGKFKQHKKKLLAELSDIDVDGASASEGAGEDG